MPRKAAEPTATPLEQAAGPPIIAETDVERRLEEELAALEDHAEVIPEAEALPQEDQHEEEPQPPP
ncbi:MAG: hypothetical protein FWC27_04400, partial [Firmicutes bacterium]|nr:hypothetical protein [Bacillota bacterium]